MWLAIVMFCAAPVDARTCNLTVNNENLYNDKQSCDVEMRSMVDRFASRGIFSQGTCVEIGVSL